MSNTEFISARLRRVADMDLSGSPIDCAMGTRFGITCKDVTCSECKRDVLRAIADEIDREKRAIYEAQMDSTGYGTSPHHIIKAYAESIGKPMNGDCITDWLNRFYITRPLFDDGEPLVPGDEIDFHGRAEMVISYVVNSNRNDDYSPYATLHLKCGASHNVPISERLRRPKKQVLDADSVPIEVGDAVWNLSDSTKWEVEKIHSTEPRISIRQLDTDKDVTGGWFLASNYSHREPDTQERIDMDAQEFSHDYWKCYGYACSKCPAMFDGKIPSEHYGVSSCLEAQKLDLLRRQRELDGRDA